MDTFTMEQLMTTEPEVRQHLNSLPASHGECARCRKLDPDHLLARAELCEDCNAEVYADI